MHILGQKLFQTGWNFIRTWGLTVSKFSRPSWFLVGEVRGPTDFRTDCIMEEQLRKNDIRLFTKLDISHCYFPGIFREQWAQVQDIKKYHSWIWIYSMFIKTHFFFYFISSWCFSISTTIFPNEWYDIYLTRVYFVTIKYM